MIKTFTFFPIKLFVLLVILFSWGSTKAYHLSDFNLPKQSDVEVSAKETKLESCITIIENTSSVCIPPVSAHPCSIMSISNVSTSGGIAHFSNTSACSASSYTDFSASINASYAQLTTCTISFTSITNPMAYSVWIDYNDNGVFDAQELVVSNNNVNRTMTVVDHFTIPLTAATGTHKMRVRGEWYSLGAPTAPCNQLSYGETEDYAFTV
ncbi:MAG: GEVED domain-containing protein, partial [Bacteroidota bacterium]